ncbi:uncharacterized protein LOC130284954 [Hyla sarda]|uniref:uncharacterized protein LOC130284954 n=1 Tax=Hyla sarda TaxID=327740 RepID=UPI0024C3EF3B|nr:uncharacterized protein LOC130284954 [Hyla sarda]
MYFSIENFKNGNRIIEKLEDFLEKERSLLCEGFIIKPSALRSDIEAKIISLLAEYGDLLLTDSEEEKRRLMDDLQSELKEKQEKICLKYSIKFKEQCDEKNLRNRKMVMEKLEDFLKEKDPHLHKLLWIKPYTMRSNIEARIRSLLSEYGDLLLTNSKEDRKRLIDDLGSELKEKKETFCSRYLKKYCEVLGDAVGDRASVVTGWAIGGVVAGAVAAGEVAVTALSAFGETLIRPLLMKKTNRHLNIQKNIMRQNPTDNTEPPAAQEKPTNHTKQLLAQEYPTYNAKPPPEHENPTKPQSAPKNPTDNTEPQPAPEHSTDNTEPQPAPENPTDNTEPKPAPENPTDNTEPQTAPEHSTDNTEPRPAPEHSTDNTEPQPAPEHSTDNTEPQPAPEHSTDNAKPTPEPENPTDVTEFLLLKDPSVHEVLTTKPSEAEIRYLQYRDLLLTDSKEEKTGSKRKEKQEAFFSKYPKKSTAMLGDMVNAAALTVAVGAVAGVVVGGALVGGVGAIYTSIFKRNPDSMQNSENITRQNSTDDNEPPPVP